MRKKETRGFLLIKFFFPKILDIYSTLKIMISFVFILDRFVRELKWNRKKKEKYDIIIT